MARQIVTQEAVTEAVLALIAEGAEPSILAVQGRVGGGSYTTIKRYLDVWRQQRAEAQSSAPDTPVEVQAKGQEFARAVWALASREAQRDAQHAKDEAAAQVTAIRGELAQASSEITRLERVESEQAAVIEQLRVKLREVELALAESQALSRRIPDLEKSLADTRVELEVSRKDVTARAVEAGRLAGEAETLRGQVQELMSAIRPKPAA